MSHPLPILPQWQDELREVGDDLRHKVLGYHLMLPSDIIEFVHHAQKTLHVREANTAQHAPGCYEATKYACSVRI